mgnify:CR=1 FL=1
MTREEIEQLKTGEDRKNILLFIKKQIERAVGQLLSLEATIKSELQRHKEFIKEQTNYINDFQNVVRDMNDMILS